MAGTESMEGHGGDRVRGVIPPHVRSTPHLPYPVHPGHRLLLNGRVQCGLEEEDTAGSDEGEPSSLAVDGWRSTVGG